MTILVSILQFIKLQAAPLMESCQQNSVELSQEIVSELQQIYLHQLCFDRSAHKEHWRTASACLDPTGKEWQPTLSFKDSKTVKKNEEKSELINDHAPQKHALICFFVKLVTFEAFPEVRHNFVMQGR